MRLPSALARHPAIVWLAALFLVTEAIVLIFGALPGEEIPPIRIGRYDPYLSIYSDFENYLRAKGVQFVLLSRGSARYNEPVRTGEVDVILPLPSEYLTYDAENPVSAAAAAKIEGLINQYNVDLAQRLLASQGQAQISRIWRPIRFSSDASYDRTLPLHLFLGLFVPALFITAIVLGTATAPATLLARLRRGGVFAVALLIELMIVTIGLEIAGRDGTVYMVGFGSYLLPPLVLLPLAFVLAVSVPAAASFATALESGARRAPRAIACIAGVAAFAIFAAVLDAQYGAFPIAPAPIDASALVLAVCAAASLYLLARGRRVPTTV